MAILVAPTAAMAATPDPIPLPMWPIPKPTKKLTYVARILTPSWARAMPGAGERLVKVSTENSWGRGGTRLLIEDSGLDDRGREWIKVHLPNRPNGLSGWIRADGAAISKNRYRVSISTRARRLFLYKDNRRIGSWRVVVGTPETPTPKGDFAVYEVLPQANPGDFIGPWALHLTAHSDVLENFGGGPGRVAMHGRSGASFLDPLGSAASHGCIRMNNDKIKYLARILRPGTPVKIR